MILGKCCTPSTPATLFASSCASSVVAGTTLTLQPISNIPLDPSASHDTVADTVGTVALAGIVTVAVGYGVVRLFREVRRSGQGSLSENEVATRLCDLTKERRKSWDHLYEGRFGTIPSNTHAMESLARKLYQQLPHFLQRSLTLREGIQGALDLELRAKSLANLPPPVTFGNLLLQAQDATDAPTLSLSFVMGLDRLSAIQTLDKMTDHFARCYRSTSNLHLRLSTANGRSTFGVELERSSTAAGLDPLELRTTFSSTMERYDRILADLHGVGRVHKHDRVMALMLSLPIAHLILRAYHAEENDLIKGALREWNQLHHEEQERYRIMDMMLGARRLHAPERGTDTAPFAATWLMSWAWERFLAPRQAELPTLLEI